MMPKLRIMSACVFLITIFFSFSSAIAQDFDSTRALAEQGDPIAQNALGDHFRQKGGELNNILAMTWYEKSAEQGNFEAQYSLGVLQGVMRKYDQALFWLRKSAAQNYAKAQARLGYHYQYGRGVTRNYNEAIRWYRLAAMQGDGAAQASLGTMYERGLGTAKDYDKAVSWYRKAAENGDLAGQNFLAGAYVSGNGVAKDFVQAYKWYAIANDQGPLSSDRMINVISAHMTPKQIEQAKILAKDCTGKEFKGCS